MSIELNELSIDELQELGKRLDRELKSKQVQEQKASYREERDRRRAVMKQVRELISAHSLSMDELLANRAKRAAKGEGRKNVSKSPPKYRNPDDHTQTWTGKGRKPGWLLGALQRGDALEGMLIPANEMPGAADA
ncbi:DNA-binding protein H-NS [Gammaproteobacteria bacterium]